MASVWEHSIPDVAVILCLIRRARRQLPCSFAETMRAVAAVRFGVCDAPSVVHDSVAPGHDDSHGDVIRAICEMTDVWQSVMARQGADEVERCRDADIRETLLPELRRVVQAATGKDVSRVSGDRGFARLCAHAWSLVLDAPTICPDGSDMRELVQDLAQTLVLQADEIARDLLGRGHGDMVAEPMSPASLRALTQAALQAGELQCELATAVGVASCTLRAWLNGTPHVEIERQIGAVLAANPFTALPPSDDVSFKYLPVSVFEVQRLGRQMLRGSQTTAQSSRMTFSPFYSDVAEWVVRFFLQQKTDIFDPFAGWGERHAAATMAGKRYIGHDLSKDAIAHAATHHGVSNLFVDSETHDAPKHDALFTCPPYWDLEMYAGDGLHRNPTWDSFLRSYRRVLTRCVAAASPAARYCIVVGDWRRAGVYYDLTFQTERILVDLGLTPHDKVILSSKKQTPIKAMIHQAKRLMYTVKVHQTMLVYDVPWQHQ